MAQARVGFGALVDNYGEKVYVVGGTVGKVKPTNKCEVYDVTADKWTELPPLSEPRFSCSLCLFTDEHLFAFAGFDGSHNFLSSIERLNISPDKAGVKWQKLGVSMPQSVSTCGSFQISQKHFVVFGGWG